MLAAAVAAKGGDGGMRVARGGAAADHGMLAAVSVDVDYEADAAALRRFFSGGADAKAGAKYGAMLQEIADLERTTLRVELDDLAGDAALLPLLERIESNTHRYLSLVSEAADAVLPPASRPLDLAAMDAADILAQHRKARGAEAAPAALTRRYAVALVPRTGAAVLSVRALRAAHIGTLVTVRGIVTRVSEVRPLLSVATYTCDACGHEVYQEVAGASFTPPAVCPTPACAAAGSRGALVLQARGSRFVRCQEARLQEEAGDVPPGHVPRGATVLLLNDLARTLSPGDTAVVSGVWTPRPHVSRRGGERGVVLADAFLHATDVRPIRAKVPHAEASDASLAAAIDALHAGGDAYGALSAGLAPEIHGHGDVKRALLLLLVGAPERTAADGLRIRGDVNVCLVGDPGVAKSQLLKRVAAVAPRGVYTTGRGSSGVGLTAAVVRDAVTGEAALDAGALVLADGGVCCIDEFDKMDEADRTAIHEAMEQQTISIAKAGITATLNARASVLAAANPASGRYNPKRSPRENINLPPALLSRFDLLFVLLDVPDADADARLAAHVCAVHRTGAPPADAAPSVPPAVLRAYIAAAQRFAPVVPGGLVEYVVGAYVGLRAADADGETYTTPRTLLAILRLAQALARLRWDDLVSQADVDEAIRLVDAARATFVSASSSPGERPGARAARTMGDVLRLVRGLADAGRVDGVPTVSVADARDAALRANFSPADFDAFVATFDQCNVLSSDGLTLRFFN